MLSLLILKKLFKLRLARRFRDRVRVHRRRADSRRWGMSDELCDQIFVRLRRRYLIRVRRIRLPLLMMMLTMRMRCVVHDHVLVVVVVRKIKNRFTKNGASREPTTDEHATSKRPLARGIRVNDAGLRAMRSVLSSSRCRATTTKALSRSAPLNAYV